MFIHHPAEAVKKRVILHWLLLSFNAGAINAGGFLATGRFVSHVTGFATLFGVHLANQEISSAIEILSVPVFFLAGAVIAGLLIDRPLYQNKTPHFDFVMGLSAICLFLASFGDYFHLGPFGEAGQVETVYILLALLCLACGLQNAAIASSSGGSIRTTHLTGLTTDLGLGLARLFTIKHEDTLYIKEKRANFLRFGSIISFAMGSAGGAIIFLKMGYHGFIFPAAIAFYATLQGRRMKQYPHRIRLPG